MINNSAQIISTVNSLSSLRWFRKVKKNVLTAVLGSSCLIATQSFAADQVFQYPAGNQWNNTANNWTGGTWVNANTAVFDTDGETIEIDQLGGVTAGGITFSLGTTVQGNQLTMGADPFTVKTDADSSISSVISGAGALTKSGSGTLTLSGANTYAGDTTVSAGTLKVGGAGNLETGTSDAAVAVASGATFEFGSSGDQTLSGVISGAGALTKSGSGTTDVVWYQFVYRCDNG